MLSGVVVLYNYIDDAIPTTILFVAVVIITTYLSPQPNPPPFFHRLLSPISQGTESASIMKRKRILDYCKSPPSSEEISKFQI